MSCNFSTKVGNTRQRGFPDGWRWPGVPGGLVLPSSTIVRRSTRGVGRTSSIRPPFLNGGPSSSPSGQAASPMMHELPTPTSKSLPFTHLRSWNIRGYDIDEYGADAAVIVVGIDYECADARHQWLHLIEWIRPSYLLTSTMAIHYYDRAAGHPQIQLDREMNRIDMEVFDDLGLPPRLKALADRFGIVLVGCRLSTAEEEAAGAAIAKASSEYDYTPFYGLSTAGEYVDLLALPESYAHLERKTANLISRYEARSSRPLVVGMMPGEARRLDRCALLRGRGFGYAYVDQLKCAETFKLSGDSFGPFLFTAQ